MCCRNASVGLPRSLSLKMVLVSFGAAGAGKGRSEERWQELSALQPCKHTQPAAARPAPQPSLTGTWPSPQAPHCCPSACSPRPTPTSLACAGSVLGCKDAAGAEGP